MQVAEFTEQRLTGRRVFAGSELEVQVQEHWGYQATQTWKQPEPINARTLEITDGAAYWGVLCRSCVELVAFDRRPFLDFGLGDACQTVGTILCSHGHSHTYSERDFVSYPKYVYAQIPLGSCRVI